MKKLKEFAEKLNGRQYRNEITSQEIAFAKENGIVVVFGASDDLIEFEGAIYGECDCYGGGTFWVSEFGEIFTQFDLEDLHKIPKGNTNSIEALWGYNENFTWAYKTDIPHETFEIMEDDEPYCKGIVFYLEDLKPKKTNFDRITESVESLAEFFVEESKQEDYKGEYYYLGCGEVGETYDKQEAIKSTIEWLQKECENEN